MRRGSGSLVEEEDELPPEDEEDDGPSHLRRSWRRRCGRWVTAAGERSAVVREEAARVAAPARRLHRRRPDMVVVGAELRMWTRVRGVAIVIFVGCG
jgi:hypothetical protein